MKYLTSTKILLNVTFVWLFSLSSWKNCSCPTPTCHPNGPILPLSKKDHVSITLGSLISGLEGVPLSARPWATPFPRGPPASGSVLGSSPSYKCSLRLPTALPHQSCAQCSLLPASVAWGHKLCCQSPCFELSPLAQFCSSSFCLHQCS